MGRVANYAYLNFDQIGLGEMDGAVIAKIHDINELLARGRVEPDAVFPELGTHILAFSPFIYLNVSG